MPFTTREIDSPDPVTRVAAADAALREPEQHDIGEKMVLNMGPSHPATHGVLRLVLELDGEIITKATPDIGFLHRGDEKIAENMQYNQFVPYTDRLDYLAPLSNNVAYALAVEKLMGWEIPPRGKAIRTICCETSRISSHLLGLGAMALDLGAMTVFLYTFTEREKLYDLFELLTGARFTTSYTRVGGQIRDLPETFIPELKKFLDDFGPSLDECDRLLTRNKIFVDRTKDIGVITKERAIAYAISGPNLRGAESNTICGANIPISITTSTISTWSSAARAIVTIVIWCDIEEMRQSARILRQVIDKLPSGPINVSELEKHDAAEIASDDKDGRTNSSFHCGDRRARCAAGRSLFRGRKSQGRAWLLHQQQRRRRSVSVENSRAVVREPQYPAGAFARLSG